MYLFFDTETNGKAKNFNAPPTDTDNWPRITQFAWQLYDSNQQLVNERMSLIKPDGWTIPKEKFFIDNNMSTERCEQYGVPLKGILEEFILDFAKAEYMVAHNISFDVNVVAAEFIRLGLRPKGNVIKVCTMKESVGHCKIKQARGGYKWPTLTELHTNLFGKPFEGAHDALDDVKACANSFFKLKQLGVIKS